MASNIKVGNLALKLLVGLLFVVIGIEGVADLGWNPLYDELDDILCIIFGLILIVAGLLIAVPLFVKGIKPSFSKVSAMVVLVVWVVYILLADFVYGLKGIDGSEWITWLENLIYHLLILASVYKVANPGIKVTATKK